MLKGSERNKKRQAKKLVTLNIPFFFSFYGISTKLNNTKKVALSLAG